MKIALIDPSLFTLPYDEALAGGLRANGHDVALFGKVLRPDEHGAGTPGLRPLFYPGLARAAAGRLPAGVARGLKGFSHIGSMVRLIRALAEWRPDVIHFQWAPLPAVDRWFLPALKRIAPVVLTVHDSNPFNGNPGSRLQRLGALSILGRFDHLIAHNQRAVDRLRACGVPAERIACIAHGLLHVADAGPAVPAPEDGPVVLLQFGKIKPYKGVDVLIRAVALLPANLRARCRVRVVGKPYMDVGPLVALAEQAGVTDVVDFTFDFISDARMAAEFRGSAAVVFPYHEIDASGVLMAALAVDRPIVASRLGTFAELLEDGRHGHLVTPGDPADLARALAAVIADPAARRAMAAEIGALKASLPSWTEIGRHTEDVYRQVLRRRHIARVSREVSLCPDRSSAS